MIGQEQDALGGLFDETQAFSGNVTQVEFWKVLLSTNDIIRLANCDSPSLKEDERVVSWGSNFWRASEAYFVTKPDKYVCESKKELYHSYYIHSAKTSYKHFKAACDQLAGEIPIITTSKDTQALSGLQTKHNQIIRSLPDGTYDECSIGQSSKFWLGLKKDSKGVWENPYNPYSNLSNFVTTESSFNCIYMFDSRQIELEQCDNPMACGVCDLNKVYGTEAGQYLKLKGICEEELFHVYDLDYYVFGTFHSRPLFKGISLSYMHYNDTDERWYIRSLREPSKYLVTVRQIPVDLPTGTWMWRVGSEGSICGLAEGELRELTFSRCFPNKYTCDSGDCIPLSSKCDTEIDCDDKSDEHNCDYMKLPKNYAKELIPRDEAGGALVVHMNISFLAFPVINTVNLKFTVDFFLNLRWYDLRIDFRDLNNVTLLNSLSPADRDQIWVPKLGFTNALGPFQTVVDDLTNGVLIREAKPLEEDVTAAIEGKIMFKKCRAFSRHIFLTAMLFSGRSNSIYISREYYQEYGCDFNLVYYPFDTQV